MAGRFLGRVMAIIFLFSVSGCATAGKKKDLEMQGLRSQILALESQLQNKEQEILILRDDLDRAMQERAIPIQEEAVEAKSRPNVRQIQTALKNAGYDLGKIDGRMGKQTREAIRSFQRANNLVVDGKVGKKTWEILRGYLGKKIK